MTGRNRPGRAELFLRSYMEDHPIYPSQKALASKLDIDPATLSRSLKGLSSKRFLRNFWDAVCNSESIHKDIEWVEFITAFNYLRNEDDGKPNPSGSPPRLACPFCDLPKQDGDEPRLTLDEISRNGKFYHFSNRLLDVLGREEEQERLVSFLEDDRTFAWLQIAGGGGQGKSRLAFELAYKAKEKGWNAGFLSKADLLNFEGKWISWRPTKPILLIVDYVIGFEDELQSVFVALCNRPRNLGQKVRLLFAERQAWNHGGLEKRVKRRTNASVSKSESFAQQESDTADIVIQTGRCAEWFQKVSNHHDGTASHLVISRFQDGVIELKTLDKKALVTIVRQSAAINQFTIPLTDAKIAEHLRRIDRSGRPLYAYFLSGALAAGTFRPDWLRADLLDSVLIDDQAKRWSKALKTAPPSLSKADYPPLRTAILATLCGHVDCVHLSRNYKDWSRLTDDERREAAILTNSPLNGNSMAGPATIIGALQPDILGEWFILLVCSRDAAIEPIIATAWHVAPREMASFLQRLAQDFPEHEETRRLLSMKPDTIEGQAALSSVAADILTTLWQARQPIPELMVHLLAEAARNNVERAARVYAFCFYAGIGVEKDRRASYTWYQKSANLGDNGGMRNVGICYLSGSGVDQDPKKAVSWIVKAIEAGNTGAMVDYGWCLENGIGIEGDPVEAHSWYRKAAEAGETPAMVRLGDNYGNGIGVEADLVEANRWFIKAAEAGDAQAMLLLGFNYERGTGVGADPVEANSWYSKAAEAGDAQAMRFLGLNYENGIGVRVDPAEAHSWYRKAAGAGDAPAMRLLGNSYARGNGVEADLVAANSWYREAAEAGNAQAMTLLGFNYSRGIGTEADPVEAHGWYRKAAEAGDAQAMRFVGLNYENGIGVSADLVEAHSWYSKAAEAGDASAMCFLGNSYARGIGVETDLIAANSWYRKAAEAGDADAKQLLAWMPTRLLPQSSSGQFEIDASDLSESADWPLPPLIAGEWQIESIDAAIVLIGAFTRYAALAEYKDLRLIALRATSLSFYPGYRLVEALLDTSYFDRPKIACMVVGGEWVFPVLGRSMPIHLANSLGILNISDAEPALEYLRFFGMAVCGEEGPFRIVDGYNVQLFTTPPTDPDEVRDVIRSAVIATGSSNFWRAKATIKYGHTLFHSDFIVPYGGVVEMKNDTPLLSNLPFRSEGFDGPFRF